jgi:Flagellar basal body-associated protein FliL
MEGGSLFEKSLWVIFCLAGAAIGAAGCGAKSKFKFDELDVAQTVEELAEFSLGDYKIPIPVAVDDGAEAQVRRNCLQFEFQLYALVAPKEEYQLAEAWERHQGVIRDKVIIICRSATVDDLQEPELATLKARLTDVLAAQLGEKRFRQLLITDVVSQPLM